MPNYYSITTAGNYEKIGNVFPQVDSLYNSESLLKSLQGDQRLYNANEGLKNLYKQPIPKDIVLEFSLNKKAILSDVLTTYTDLSGGLLISQKLQQLIVQFPLENIEFVPCLVHTKKDPQPYYLLYPRKNLIPEYIDISRTTLVVLDNIDKNLRMEYKVNNGQHLEQRLQNIGVDKWLTVKDKLYLLNDYIPSSAVILLRKFHHHIFISESLKKAMEENGITNLHIHQQPLMINEQA